MSCFADQFANINKVILPDDETTCPIFIAHLTNVVNMVNADWGAIQVNEFITYMKTLRRNGLSTKQILAEVKSKLLIESPLPIK